MNDETKIIDGEKNVVDALYNFPLRNPNFHPNEEIKGGIERSNEL